MGGATGNTLTINGGTIRSNSTAARDLTGKYSGGITIGGNFTVGNATNNGLLTFSNNMALGGADRTITVSSGAVFGGVISGSAGVGITKEGTGQLTLSNANVYTGVTTINGGILSLGNVSALQNTSGITMATGTTLRSTLSSVTIAAPITTAGTVTINPPNNNVGQVFSELILNGAIGGSGNVNFTSILNANTIQTVTLGAANNYSGNTLLDNTAGTAGQIIVKLGATDALPTTTVVTIDGQIGAGTGRGAEINLFGFNQTLAGLTNTPRSLRVQRVVNSDLSPAATLTINGATNTAFGGFLGSGAQFSVSAATMPGSTNGNNFGLTKNGSGTFTLNPVTLVAGAATYTGNSYSGPTKVLGGILSLGHSLAMQNSPLDTAGSIVGDPNNGLRTTVASLTLGGLTGNKDFATVFETTTGGYTTLSALTLNPLTGVTRIYAGDTGNGNGSMTLTKTGAGTQVLSGMNTYTGATSINAGTLLVNGSISTSSMTTVKNTATLGGSGTVGNVTVETGGTIAPGNSPGILSTNNITTTGGTYSFEIGGAAPGNLATDHDQLSVTGSLTLGSSIATISITNYGGYIPTGSEMFVLIKNDGSDPINGEFIGISEGSPVNVGGVNFYATYQADAENNLPAGGNDFALIPEPGNWTLALGAGGLLLLRRNR